MSNPHLIDCTDEEQARRVGSILRALPPGTVLPPSLSADELEAYARSIILATTGITTSRENGRSRPRGYLPKYHPNRQTVALLEAAMEVLAEYRRYLPLTARQIFYRLVGTRGYEKSERAYARLCEHLANARRARLIPFDDIRDDGASVMEEQHFDGEGGFWAHVRGLTHTYRRDKLAGQRVYLEVWCEAGGMMAQLANVAHPYSVPVYSCGGFDSLTAKHMLAGRVCSQGKRAVILHLGDFDPSGVSIFESVAEDVAAFVKTDFPYYGATFKRLALTAEQVDRYRLPTAPAKASDSRSRRWRGATCQLEALAPDQIAGLLELAIRAELDLDRLEEDRAQEDRERQRLALALPAAGRQP